MLLSSISIVMRDMQMSNITSKLKALQLDLSDGLLVDLFDFLPTHFGQLRLVIILRNINGPLMK